MSSNGGKSIRTEPVTAQKRESFEIGERRSQELQALISNSHSLKPQLLKKRVLGGEHNKPSMNISPPVQRDQIEIRKTRLPFERHAPNVGKSPSNDLRRNGVAVADEHVGPGPSLRVVPVLAHKRD